MPTHTFQGEISSELHHYLLLNSSSFPTIPASPLGICNAIPKVIEHKNGLPGDGHDCTIRVVRYTLPFIVLPESIRLVIARQHLIIFIRYPKPGTAKAGLVAVLGERGAADLQRAMAEHTIEAARAFARAYRGNRSIEIRYTEGDGDGMLAWLGDGIQYTPQCDGSPGEQISEALTDAFEVGAESVLLVCTDCPTITRGHLESAVSALHSGDLAIGPATEGRYYLIGIHRRARFQAVPALFRGVAWGSGYVLGDLLSAATNLGLTYQLLERLPDVSSSKDLPVWDRARLSGAAAKHSLISLIVPAYNDADTIGDTLDSIAPGRDMEVIVADGGSTDDTVPTAFAHGAHVVEAPKGRATQLAAGIAEVSGLYLLLLSAGTALAPGFDRSIRTLLADPGISCGAFTFRIDSPLMRYRAVEFWSRVKTGLLHLPGIEQGLFMRAATVHEVAEIPENALSGDFELMRRLARLGRIVISPIAATVSTSHAQERTLR